MTIAETTDSVAGGERFHGRNRVSSRAIRSVVSAVAAGELGAKAKAVGVELADDNGALAITVSAPVRISSLTAVADGRRVSTHIPSVVERASVARTTIRERVQHLTGSSIETVNVRLTSARIEHDGRVQ